MPAYKETRTLKDGKTVTSWLARFYCNGKQRKKRGFKTKKEAVEYELNYINEHEGSPEMLFKDYTKLFINDKSKTWSYTSVKTNTSKINNWIVPYFGDIPLNEVTQKKVREWFDYLETKNLSESYKNKLRNILSSMFNHAVRYYELKENPCNKAGTIGSKKTKEIEFWTLEEYKEFISHVDKLPYKVAYDTLYYTGLRIGELKALTLNDIDKSVPKIMVTKSYQKIKGGEIITAPKTESSIRDVTIPVKLLEEILELTEHYPYFENDEMIFKLSEQAYRKKIKDVCEEFGLKPIRVHDLRHSHASYLINIGKDPALVSRRLGHSSITETLNTYTHLFTQRENELIKELDSVF